MSAEYRIISSSNQSSLEEDVVEALNSGYLLSGGIFIEYTADEVIMYHQSVYKPQRREWTVKGAK